MRTRLMTLALITSVLLLATAAFARQSGTGYSQPSASQSRMSMPQGSMHMSRPTVASNVKIMVDGKMMRPPTPPLMMNGHVLLPMRSVFEQLGANVNWNASRHEVMATKGDRRMMLRVGDRNAEVNGKMMALDSAPMMYRNNVYVPLRAVSEALGANVAYNSSRREVAITTSRPVVAAPAMPRHAAMPPEPDIGLPASAKPIQGATILVDGKKLSATDEPVMIGNTVMVPAQAVLQDLNARPNWNAQQHRLTATYSGQRISVIAGNRSAMIGNRTERLSETPFVYRNQVYVPLDFIGRAVGGTATWEASRKEVVINTQARRAT